MVDRPNKFKQFVRLFFHHFQMAQVTTSAAVLAYYTLLSIFPAILITGNILPMVGMNATTVLGYLRTAVPSTVFSFIKPIVYDFLKHGSGGMLTTSAIVALWSTSQGVAAFQRSVNHAYGVAENQNPVLNRAISFVWMIVLMIILFLIAFVYGLGEEVLKQLQPVFKFNVSYIRAFAQLKWPVTFIVLFVALTLLYYFVPNARVRLRFVVVGAVIVALLWMALSRGFSLFAHLLTQRVNSYRTIAAFIAMMIWLDFSGILVMLGATINATLQEAHEGEIAERRHLIEWLRETRQQNQK